MNDSASYIHIPFHKWSALQIISFCDQSYLKNTPEWENAVYQFILAWFGPDQTMTVHTSGSTGTPKPIQLEKKQMIASAKATGEYLRLSKGDVALLCLPEKYIAGKMMIVRAIVLGLDLILVEPKARPLDQINIDIDFTAMVPNQVYQSHDQLHRISKLIIGGGPVSSQLGDMLISVKGEIYHTYGMTETITHVAMRRLNGHQLDAYFHALPGVKFEVDDRGCLVVRAPRVSKTPVITNDLVELKDEHAFRWLGRYDHVIISGGIKIIPEKLERQIAHLFDQRYFIAGIKDKVLGEKVILIVEGGAKGNTYEEDLIREMQYILPRHHVPKEIVFLEKFVETTSGKVKRKKSLELFLLGSK